MVFTYSGTEAQQRLAREAIAMCSAFPNDRLLPSLAREGKTQVPIAAADLSRYNARVRIAGEESDHSHVHDGDRVGHPITREIDGRQRVYGLFWLPPHTKIEWEVSLEQSPDLAREIIIDEYAHCLDYHWLIHQPDGRRRITNLFHRDQLPPGHSTADGVAFRLDGHTCSWFDVGSYADWVGEALMELVYEMLTGRTSTMNLRHVTTPEIARAAREIFDLVDEADDTAPAYFALQRSNVFHDSHAGIPAERTFDTTATATAAGLRPCRVCKPR